MQCTTNARIPFLSSAPINSDSQFLKAKKLTQFLVGQGWYQVLNYSFCDPDYYKEILKDKMYLEELYPTLDSQNNQRAFSVDNPISSQLSLMKPLLVPDLIQNSIENFRHNNKFGKIFEVSPVFYQTKNQYKQELHLGLACWGSPIDIWNNKLPPHIYSLKSVLESICKVFRIKGVNWKSSDISFLHPKQTLFLMFQNQVVGFLGSLHPYFLKKYKIPVDITLAEIHWEWLAQRDKKPLKFKSFSQLLTIEKDLCFIIPKDQDVGDVQKEIKKSLGNICDKVEVFDVYEKNNERSISFRMFLKQGDESWTDEHLKGFLNKAISSVEKKFFIRLK